jgi:hypothetical protein
MKNRYYFIPSIVFFFFCSCFTAKAQMKSCCEPDGVILVSTVKQTAGTLKMVKILDSIGRNADPEDFYLMNNARMEWPGPSAPCPPPARTAG